MVVLEFLVVKQNFHFVQDHPLPVPNRTRYWYCTAYRYVTCTSTGTSTGCTGTCSSSILPVKVPTFSCMVLSVETYNDDNNITAVLNS